MSLRRDCTLSVHVPEALGVIDRPTLVNACLGVVDKRQLKCVQAVGAYYRVTFVSVEGKETFASKGLVINGVNIPLQAPDYTTLVRIVRLPFEVSEESLAATLNPFGVILSQSLEKDKNDGLFTGTRLVRMRLSSTVPNKLFVAGYPCFAWYPGQPKLCYVCRSSGHLVADCPNRGLCRNCRKPGHVATKCPDRRADQADRPFTWGTAPGASADAPASEQQPKVVTAEKVSSKGDEDVANQSDDSVVPSDSESEGGFETSSDVPEAPAKKIGKEVDDEESKRVAPISVTVMEEGDSSAPGQPPEPQKAPVEITSSSVHKVAKHRGAPLAAAADIVALEFARTRSRSLSRQIGIPKAHKRPK